MRVILILALFLGSHHARRLDTSRHENRVQPDGLHRDIIASAGQSFAEMEHSLAQEDARALGQLKPMATLLWQFTPAARWRRRWHMRMAAPKMASAPVEPPFISRRSTIAGLAGVAATLTSPLLPANAAVLEPKSDYSLGVSRPQAGRDFYEVILPPVRGRATVRTALGRSVSGDGIWGFEQLLQFTNISATIRMTVVRLVDGTLWVHAPVAPTGECLALLRELGGDVSHIVLPVISYEHKAFFGPFVRNFPKAKTWVAPGQFGPFGALKPRSADGSGANGYDISMPYRVDGVLGDASNPPPWAGQIAMKLFYVDLPDLTGPVSEAAFFHKASRTLLCTDAVVFVPPTPSPIFETLFGAARVAESDFWPKSVLTAFFMPAEQEPDGSWPAFERICGRLLCTAAQIPPSFEYRRAFEQSKVWVDDVTNGDWNFDRIISAHFGAPIGSTSPAEFRAAFGPLYGEGRKI